MYSILLCPKQAGGVESGKTEGAAMCPVPVSRALPGLKEIDEIESRGGVRRRTKAKQIIMIE